MIFSGTSPDGELVEIIELKRPPMVFWAANFTPSSNLVPWLPILYFKKFYLGSKNTIKDV